MAELPATKETGSALNWGPYGSITAWEENPELIYPNSVRVFDIMRRTDGQVAAILRAISLLIRQTTCKMLGSDVDPRIMSYVESDLGLQADQDGRRRQPESGFNWDDFLRQALTFGPFGHAYFNQFYLMAENTRDPFTDLPISAHVQLSFRPQRTIAGFNVADNGSLISIEQYVRKTTRGGSQFDTVPIPASALVAFVNEREGGDWAGQSWLRACWFNWSTKTKLMIMDAIGIERNSVGIPKWEYSPSNSTAAQALTKAEKIRGGETSAVAVEKDIEDVSLLGIQGTIRDPLPSIKYHNEEIGRSLLAMVLNLGHDRGAQALGDTMYSLFCSSLNAVTDYLQSAITEQVIRPLVAYNFGTDEPYPALVFEEIQPEAPLSPEQLKALVDAGIIIPDRTLENDRRRRHDLPPAEPTDPGGDDLVAPTPMSEVTVLEEPKLQAASKNAQLEQMRERADRLIKKIDEMALVS